MEIRILGPLEVGDPPSPIGGGKPRALLALLVLNAGRTLSRDRIIDELWGEEVPDTAAKMVQIHVSQLRKALPPGLLVTRASGYAVEVPGEAVDLHRAERLLRDARAARERDDPETAARLLNDALQLWRGAALAEFDEPFAHTEAPRIEQLHLTLVEERIDADLALGRHADLVGELEALVGRHPLRERARAQLMLALYRCGRQADALAAYADARRTLDEELGLEPSAALREMERRVLRQDPALDAPSRPAPRPTPAPVRAGPVRPPVRYARSGDLSIAYEVTGTGPPDLVLIPGFVSHLTMDREEPRHVRFLDRLASFSRLIRFDKRGTGLSDRPSGLPDLETRMDDVRAVMDAAGSRRAVLLGYSEGGPLAILAAAAHPERVAGLVLIGSYAKRVDPDEDYPWAMPREERRRHIDQLERDWGFEAMMTGMCPRADEAMARWWGERCRAAASPGAARALTEMNSLIDVRHVLPAVRVPTLVLHRSGDMRVVVGNGRYLGERIPGARYVELPGADHFVAVDGDQLLDVVEPWVRALGDPPAADDDDRVLATIVAAEDVGGRDVVHREVKRHRGRPGGSEGVALFDGPSRALRCGLALATGQGRVGVSTGEVTGVEGPAVGVAAALARCAEPGQVLAGSTTRDLAAGSDLAFTDLGERRLPGDPAPRRVFAVALAAPEADPFPARRPPSRTRAGRPPFVGRDRERRS